MHYPHGRLKHSCSRWCALSMTRLVLCYFFVLFYKIGVVNFSHVRHTGNKPARILARQAQNLVNDVIWIKEIPCCI